MGNAATIYITYDALAQAEPESKSSSTTAKTGAKESTSETKSETKAETKAEGTTSEGTTGESTTAEAKQPDNPILPTGIEFVAGAITFTLLWALMKFVLLKPVMKGMEQRNDKVRGDLAAADEARRQAEQALVEYKAGIAAAKAEATRVIEDGRAQGEAKRREALAAAEADAVALRTQTADEVTAAKAEALGQLRGGVSTIAVQAAGAVIGKPLDEGAQRQLVDQYLSQSGTGN